ncbi:hypothetical protein LXL04_023849 [Taraxacum kok-saghyz]
MTAEELELRNDCRRSTAMEDPEHNSLEQATLLRGGVCVGAYEGHQHYYFSVLMFGPGWVNKLRAHTTHRIWVLNKSGHLCVNRQDMLEGLAYNATENVLYVADTVNHALRLIDFVNEDVQTMAGNGTKGSGGRKGTNQILIPDYLCLSFWFSCFTHDFLCQRDQKQFPSPKFGSLTAPILNIFSNKEAESFDALYTFQNDQSLWMVLKSQVIKIPLTTNENENENENEKDDAYASNLKMINLLNMEVNIRFCCVEELTFTNRLASVFPAGFLHQFTPSTSFVKLNNRKEVDIPNRFSFLKTALRIRSSMEDNRYKTLSTQSNMYPSDHGRLRDGETQTRASHRISHDPKDYAALGHAILSDFKDLKQVRDGDMKLTMMRVDLKEKDRDSVR